MDAMDWCSIGALGLVGGTIAVCLYVHHNDNLHQASYALQENKRAAECEEKEGTYLRNERVCLDLSHIRLGQDTSSVSVLIYGAPWCSPCSDAIAYLDKRHIQYVEKNIDDNANKIEMQSVLDQAGMEHGLIPVIVIGKKGDDGMPKTPAKVIRGWDQSDVAEAISEESTYAE